MATRPGRILVGFDGSRSSQQALEAAADLVGYGSSLDVVHVRCAEWTPSGAVAQARTQLVRRQLTARHLERDGEPARQIVAAAEELGADLIVVGRPEATGRRDSVAAEVVRNAPCDVLVVH